MIAQDVGTEIIPRVPDVRMNHLHKIVGDDELFGRAFAVDVSHGDSGPSVHALKIVFNVPQSVGRFVPVFGQPIGVDVERQIIVALS